MNNPFNEDILDRLLYNRKIDSIKGCWLWTGGTTWSGYGYINCVRNGKRTQIVVHRLIAYLCLGLDLDSVDMGLHNCDVRRCFNPHPKHVFIGDNYDNMRGASERGRIVTPNMNVTYCWRGHEFTPENTTTYNGHKHCNSCNVIRNKEKQLNRLKRKENFK